MARPSRQVRGDHARGRERRWGRDVAAALAEHHVSGVPVVSEGRIVGVISESDIVRKECGPERTRRGFVGRLRRQDRNCGIDAATTAEEAMTSPAVVGEDWMTAYHAAWLMQEHHVNRLPVLHEGRLVGVISCADLVRHFARRDGDVAAEVRSAVHDPDARSRLRVGVYDGMVVPRGEVDDPRDLAGVPRIATHVPGVVSVDSRLRLRGVGPGDRTPPAPRRTRALHRHTVRPTHA